MFTKRYVNVLGVLIGVAVVSSILLYSGCGMTSRPNVPTPTPTPAPTPTPDTTPPTSTITSPTAGATVLTGVAITITGTASDTGGGSVVRVEVSVDGGATFSAATGTNAWSFNWTPSALGQATIKSRAVDNSENVQNPPAEIHVTVDAPPTSTITSPTAGAIILIGTPVAITGTASDAGGGSVVRVEVSVDGGASFSAATGTNAWSFNWTPSAPGPATIKSRAVDNNGNQQEPPAEITVTVKAPVTIRVPSDQPTIQAAIDVATFGDTVLVAPGTYPENINFKGKAITVRSESGPEVTIIDGGLADSVVTFTSGEGRGSALNGFTLQNGRSDFANQETPEGGGVKVIESSPTITNNVITNNHACAGGGIGSRSGSPLIQMNTITGNNATNICPAGFGGGINIQGSASIDSRVEILDNVISDNVSSGKGGGIFMFGATIAKRNIIKGNRVELEGEEGQGGGIWTNSVPALIVQNLITGNHAYTGGGIYWFASQGLIGPIVINNTIADNDAPLMGSGIFANGFDGQAELTNNIIVAKPGQAGLHCGDSDGNIDPIIRFNNIFSSTRTAYGGTCSDMTGINGNISANPLFANPTQGDYRLQPASPSIDAGDNTAPHLPDTDIEGDPRLLDGDDDGTPIIDMGVDEVLLPPGFTMPVSIIRSPVEGATILTGTTVSITGTARDTGGGTVALVEVSVDGGSTWSAATGTTAWSSIWTPATPGPATIKSRAVDDSGNVQDPPAEITVAVRSPIRVPSDQPTIQAAIDVANNHDTVLVAPGTYFEHIDFRGKAITVTSESGPQVTIIDAGNTDPVVRFTSREGRDSVLNGFTLQNGRTNFGGGGAPPDGGGIVINSSSPKITNNVITNNHASRGSGIGIVFGSPLIQLNTITDNINDVTFGGGGGGILISGEGSAEILDNVISNNVNNGGGGGIYIPGAGATPIIKRNVIKGNNVLGGQGGGIYMVNNSSPLIVQNIITGNQASNGGGIYWAVPGTGVRGPILVNNTIADNNATTNGSGIFADGADDQVELTNNIIVAKPGQAGLHCGNFDGHIDPIIRFNNIFSAGGMAYGGSCSDKTGTDGNISLDPLFTNPTQGDYHLQQGSPSIDAGDNQAPNLLDTDLDGNTRILDGDGDGTATIDMGVDEFLAPPSEGISLIESRLKKAAVLNLRLFAEPRASSWTKTRATKTVPVPAHRSPDLPAY